LSQLLLVCPMLGSALFEVFDNDSNKDLQVILREFVDEGKLRGVLTPLRAEALHQGLGKLEGGHRMHEDDPVLDSAPGMEQA